MGYIPNKGVSGTTILVFVFPLTKLNSDLNNIVVTKCPYF
jgi:hypothetical protein